MEERGRCGGPYALAAKDSSRGGEKRRGSAAPLSGKRGFSATVEREEKIFGRRRAGGEEEKESDVGWDLGREKRDARRK